MVNASKSSILKQKKAVVPIFIQTRLTRTSRSHTTQLRSIMKETQSHRHTSDYWLLWTEWHCHWEWKPVLNVDAKFRDLKNKRTTAIRVVVAQRILTRHRFNTYNAVHANISTVSSSPITGELSTCNVTTLERSINSRSSYINRSIGITLRALTPRFVRCISISTSNQH